jgi:hypothetical protein
MIYLLLLAVLCLYFLTRPLVWPDISEIYSDIKWPDDEDIS